MIIGAQPIFISGGASGSDLQFGMCAGKAGHQVFHYIFEGHGSKAPKSEHVKLTQDQLDEGDPFLIRANETLGRSYPTEKLYVNNLLRRNYMVQRDVHALYAISAFDRHGLVFGGTAWACQMMIDRFEGKPAPLYMFDQALDTWFAHAGGQSWELIDGLPPLPGTNGIDVWSGIGTRSLEQNGKEQIRLLTGYTG